MPTIRPSMLSSYNDCARKAAGRSWKKEIEKAGYKLNNTLPSIGASVGTATHSVVENYYRSRIELQEFNEKTAIEKAVEEVKVESATGILWDDTTQNIDTAYYQISRMAKLYIESVGKFVIPLIVEERIEAEISENWILSGQIDLAALSESGNTHLHDTKTGAIMAKSYHAQVGAYSMLWRSNTPQGLPKDVSDCSVDFIPRTPKSRVQDLVRNVNMSVSLCEKAAWATIQRVIRDFEEFQKTKNPEVFPENPMSLMCSEKYCPCFGTDFCPITKDIKK